MRLYLSLSYSDSVGELVVVNKIDFVSPSGVCLLPVTRTGE